jgi:hypothetical protein
VCPFTFTAIAHNAQIAAAELLDNAILPQLGWKIIGKKFGKGYKNY